MDDIAEMRERISALERELEVLRTSSMVNANANADADEAGNANRDNGSPVAAVESRGLTAYDVVWYPKKGVTPAWYVYYPGDCFTYDGMAPESLSPKPDEDGFVGLASTAPSASVYLHAVIGLEEDGKTAKSVKSLTFDTNEKKGAGEKEKVIDIKLAKIKDFSVSQIVRGALVYKNSDTINRSCFRIETVRGGNGGDSENQIKKRIVDCYYNTGGITRKIGDVNVDDLLSGKTSEQESGATYICLKLEGDDDSIVAITEDELKTEQRKAASYVLPLYRYVGATLTVDLRTAPQIQYWEDDLT